MYPVFMLMLLALMVVVGAVGKCECEHDYEVEEHEDGEGKAEIDGEGLRGGGRSGEGGWGHLLGGGGLQGVQGGSIGVEGRD